MCPVPNKNVKTLKQASQQFLIAQNSTRVSMASQLLSHSRGHLSHRSLPGPAVLSWCGIEARSCFFHKTRVATNPSNPINKEVTALLLRLSAGSCGLPFCLSSNICCADPLIYWAVAFGNAQRRFSRPQQKTQGQWRISSWVSKWKDRNGQLTQFQYCANSL